MKSILIKFLKYITKIPWSSNSLRTQKFDSVLQILTFPSYRFVRCVQFSTLSAVFDTMIWILLFSNYRFVRCVQLSTMSGVFDTLIWILMFPSYRFVHCVQLSVMSTVFDTLIVGLYSDLIVLFPSYRSFSVSNKLLYSS